MIATYCYSFENYDLGVIEVSEEAAEAMRSSEWQSASDLPDDIEYAIGIDENGRPGQLHRMAM